MTELTRGEQEAGIARMRRWGPEARREVIELPPAERDLVLLAAGLFDMEPGVPELPDRDVITIGGPA